ncbi:MAG TPA: RNA methyltransferase [Ktedonobacteraceae bacterium]|nr:RNA methyltransferase [Ktedonobacteraceae bacterium]
MITHTKRNTPLIEQTSPLIKRIQRLHTREERERTGLFYIEGMRFVTQALHHHARIERLVVCRELLTHPYAQQLTRGQQRQGTPILEVSRTVMERLSQVQNSQGLGAVVRQRWQRLERVRPRTELCWVAVETIRTPGNLGTILRTSDAVGGAGLMLLGDTTDPYDPGTVRATMGAQFTQCFVRTSIDAIAHWKRRKQYLLIGTSPTASQDYQQVCYTAPTILWMGEERKGLSAEQQAMCDLIVRIPMVGESDSLNVAMATGVMLYEVFNQRRKQT